MSVVSGRTVVTSGAYLSQAARCASETERMLIAATLHLDAADLEPSPEFAGIIDNLGKVAVYLQALADDFGHAQAERHAGAAVVGERRVVA